MLFKSVGNLNLVISFAHSVPLIPRAPGFCGQPPVLGSGIVRFLYVIIKLGSPLKIGSLGLNFISPCTFKLYSVFSILLATTVYILPAVP